MLRDLRPDTEYKVTLVPVYSDVEGKRSSENGKTSEFEAGREELNHKEVLHTTHKLQIIKSYNKAKTE